MLGWFLFAFLSCQERPVELLIAEDKLVNVLADTHMAEAAIQNLIKSDKDSVGEVYYQQIYEIHGIAEADFEQTMTILREDPIRMEKIYNQVLEKLSTEKAENK